MSETVLTCLAQQIGEVQLFEATVPIYFSFSSKAENSTHLARRQTTWAKYVQIQTDPGLSQGLDGDSAGYLLIVNDKVRVALVVVEDDIDLGVHPVVHTGVEKVTGRVTRVDGWRSPHGGVSYS